jgi:hypothetical protein
MKILPCVIFGLVIILAWMTMSGSSGYDDPVFGSRRRRGFRNNNPVGPTQPMAYPDGPGRRRHKRRGAKRSRGGGGKNVKRVCAYLE